MTSWSLFCIFITGSGNKNTENFTTVAFGLRLIRQLQGVLDTAYFALEHGIETARGHFAETDLTPWKDKQAFSTLVRLHAKHYLDTHSVEAFELEPFTNLCGIWIHADDYLLKVLKISDEDLHKAATDPTGRDEQLNLLLDGDDLIARLPLHLLWLTDDAGYSLKTHLAYPKYPDAKAHEYHWCLEISEPTDRIQEPPISTGGDLDLGGEKSAEATA